MPNRSWFPERRDTCTELLGLSLSINPDSGCMLNGTQYKTPAEIPAELWSKVGRAHFNDKSLDVIRRMKQELQPYLKNAPRGRYTHSTSGRPPHLLPSGKPVSGE